MAASNILAQTSAELIAAWTEIGQTLGSAMDWYDPLSANNPLASANDQGSVMVYFDRSSLFDASKSKQYGKPQGYVAYDRAGIGVGDYLSDGTTTYFLINQDDYTPSQVVETNATVTFFRPGVDAPTTPQAASRYVKTNQKGDGLLMAANWPISLLSGSRGEKDETNNPFGGREPWFNFLCPSIPGVRLQPDDIMVDSENFRYQISGCELTDMGYRGTARWKMS